ncbi:Multidrug resistance-associated protein 1 [Phlyctochytrium planicorne]|nr:Multidrug resistance-associated protein 1 [Phlyctochytrium planicorne]
METIRSSPTPLDDPDGGDLKPDADLMKALDDDDRKGWKEDVHPLTEPVEKPFDDILREHPGFLGSWSIFSIFPAGYFNRLMKTSASRPLEFEDLPQLRTQDQTESLVGSFEPVEAKIRKYLSEKEQDPAAVPDVKLVPSIIRSGRVQLSLLLLMKALTVAASLYIPFVLKALIVYLQKKRYEEMLSDKEAIGSVDEGPASLLMTALFASVDEVNTVSESLNETMVQETESFQPVNWVPLNYSGVALCFLMSAVVLVKVFSDVVAMELSRKFSISGSAMLESLVFKKSLNLSHSASKQYENAVILALINVECREVIDSFIEILDCIIVPIHVACSFIALVSLLGLSVYPSAILILSSLVIMAIVAYEINNCYFGYQETDDGRVSSIRELLMGMRAIKLESQEQARSGKARLARERQMKYVRRGGLALTILFVMVTFPNALIPISSFVLYAMKNGEIDAAIIFPALMFFEPLLEPIQYLPANILGVLSGVKAFRKVKEFLFSEEHRSLKVDEKDDMDPHIAIEFKDATLKWDARQDGHGHSDEYAVGKDSEQNVPSGILLRDNEPLFKDLNLKIPKGKLTVIVGVVGSGKSSLISACLGEMSILSGSVKIRGNLAFCEQRPWLQSRTIEENIIFGNAKDEYRLRKVVQCCGLDRDIEDQMERGLQTQIGEKGITLSGGQKARIALARVVYDNSAEVFLLDDPLSALDARVSTLVFDQCILRALAGKTRILVTHQIQVLSRADHIVVLDNGRVVEQGTYQNLMKGDRENPGALKSMMDKFSKSQGAKISRRRPLPRRQDSIAITRAFFDSTGTESSLPPSYKEEDEEESEVGDVKQVYHGNHLIASEDSGSEKVSLSLLKAACGMAGGYPVAALCIASFLFAGLTSLLRELWLTWWTEQKIGLSNDRYILGYTVIGALSAVGYGAMGASTSYGGVQLSKRIHDAALNGLLGAKISFYDSQPLGRILSRMTGEFVEIDTQAWVVLANCFMTIATIISAAGSVIYSNYYSVIVLAVVVGFQFYIGRPFRGAVRDLKRIWRLERSPVASHMSECLNGVVTLRAFRAESRNLGLLFRLKDRALTAQYVTASLFNWLLIRNQVLMAGFLLFASLYGVLAPKFSPSLLGLAIQAGDQISKLSAVMTRQWIYLELQLFAIEKILHYCFNLPQEAPSEQPKDPSPDAWPKQGGIVMTDVSIKYESMDEPVVKNLSLSIRPGEKIGIVGRTGSGKSTLISALFRLLELHEGKIEIDGVDISRVGLRTLRSRLQAIPQEPYVFGGTIRSNVDPLEQFGDDEVWKALELAGLKEFVAAKEKKLEMVIEYQGENLSLGQKQLLILARILCASPKILVLDEASAAVDVATDELIQHAIKVHFKDTTVLSIAHRLLSIADYDRVIVMDGGKVVEFDTPAKLLGIQDGHFRGLVDASGSSSAAFIQKIAEQHERSLSVSSL